MDTIICNNRWISGIKQILIVVFLFICFSCIFFPIVFYSFIIELKNDKGKRIDRKVFKNIQVAGGRTVVNLDSFRFKTVPDGCYFLVYTVKEQNPPYSRK